MLVHWHILLVLPLLPLLLLLLLFLSPLLVLQLLPSATAARPHSARTTLLVSHEVGQSTASCTCPLPEEALVVPQACPVP